MCVCVCVRMLIIFVHRCVSLYLHVCVCVCVCGGGVRVAYTCVYTVYACPGTEAKHVYMGIINVIRILTTCKHSNNLMG